MKLLSSGSFEYRHSGGDSTSDEFRFRVHVSHSGSSSDDESSESPDELGDESSAIRFAISILPVNDETFQMITRYPLLKVIQGRSAVSAVCELKLAFLVLYYAIVM